MSGTLGSFDSLKSFFSSTQKSYNAGARDFGWFAYFITGHAEPAMVQSLVYPFLPKALRYIPRSPKVCLFSTSTSLLQMVLSGVFRQ